MGFGRPTLCGHLQPTCSCCVDDAHLGSCRTYICTRASGSQVASIGGSLAVVEAALATASGQAESATARNAALELQLKALRDEQQLALGRCAAAAELSSQLEAQLQTRSDNVVAERAHAASLEVQQRASLWLGGSSGCRGESAGHRKGGTPGLFLVQR